MKADLTDDFVKTLREKLLSNWANATLTSLPFHELLVKHLTQTSNINTAGGLVANVLDPVLACGQ